MRQQLQVFELKLREKLRWRGIDREPEPSNEMIDLASVISFDTAGIDSGYLAPVYLLNAHSLAQKIPMNARVLDLGSGSGRFISLLARLRPDIWITGVDLSEEMIDLAHKNFKAQSLFPRVRIVKMDMIEAVPHFPDHDAIISLFSLHHLLRLEDVKSLFKNISVVATKRNLPIWFFDFHRPKTEYSCRVFPHVFTPGGSQEFILDTENSMKAAFTAKEIVSALDGRMTALLESHMAKPIKFYQTLTNLRDFPTLPVNIPKILPPETYEVAKMFSACFELPHLYLPD